MVSFYCYCCTRGLFKKRDADDRLSAYVNLWAKAEFTKMYDEYVGESLKRLLVQGRVY